MVYCIAGSHEACPFNTPLEDFLPFPGYRPCRVGRRHLKKMFMDKIVIETPVATIESREPSSIAGGRHGRRYVEELKANLEWLGFKRKPDMLIVFDDVITTGAHFKALKELIEENSVRPPQIIGLFWARGQKPGGPI